MTQKRALGLDFGTTNTVMALSDNGGASHSMRFTSSAGTDDSMRTALSFMKDAGLGAAASSSTMPATAVSCNRSRRLRRHRCFRAR